MTHALRGLHLALLWGALADATGVPLGTVVPTNTELTARPDIFLTARNFGTVNLWGADLAVDLLVGKHLSLEGSYWFVNKDFFVPERIALNASRSKGSLAVAWRDDRKGWSVQSRVRALKGFPVSSGLYSSAADPTDPNRLLPIDSYAVVNLQGTWRPGFGSRSLLFSVNVQDLLNKHYATFVGIPRIGRVLLTRLTYTL